MSRAMFFTWHRCISALERIFFFELAQPAAKSAPSVASAVNECFVPRLLSKMKPGKSSCRMVTWWPSELCTCNWFSFWFCNTQLPTTSFRRLLADRMGCEEVPLRTAARARCSFSRNSPRFSGESGRQTNGLVL